MRESATGSPDQSAAPPGGDSAAVPLRAYLRLLWRETWPRTIEFLKEHVALDIFMVLAGALAAYAFDPDGLAGALALGALGGALLLILVVCLAQQLGASHALYAREKARADRLEAAYKADRTPRLALTGVVVEPVKSNGGGSPARRNVAHVRIGVQATGAGLRDCRASIHRIDFEDESQGVREARLAEPITLEWSSTGERSVQLPPGRPEYVDVLTGYGPRHEGDQEYIGLPPDIPTPHSLSTPNFFRGIGSYRVTVGLTSAQGLPQHWTVRVAWTGKHSELRAFVGGEPEAVHSAGSDGPRARRYIDRVRSTLRARLGKRKE